jgi:hypothetical protein
MRTIAKLLTRELFSLSTVFLVAIPLGMQMSGDLKKYNFDWAKQEVSAFVNTTPAHDVFQDLTSSIQHYNPITLASHLSKGGKPVYIASSGPIFLPQ